MSGTKRRMKRKKRSPARHRKVPQSLKWPIRSTTQSRRRWREMSLLKKYGIEYISRLLFIVNIKIEV
jgi:hypothetical protein